MTVLLACNAGVVDPPDCPLANAEVCPDGACAPNDFSAMIYALWKAKFLDVHGIDEAQFDAHITIRAVNYEMFEGGERVRIEFEFVVDWVVVRESATVAVLQPQFPGDPGTDLDDAVRLAVGPGHERYEITAVASPEEVEDAFLSCSKSMDFDWCDPRFVNVTGQIRLSGIEDLGNDQCLSASVDAISATVLDCSEGPCSMN